jgi:hypothetical protein
MASISLVELRRMAESLNALRGGTISGAVMRSDLRQVRLEMADGTLAVIRIDNDDVGRPRFEVDVIRPAAHPASQLEVRFESA